MFDHLKSTDCFEGAIGRSGKRTFCCRYYFKENFGCKILVVNSIQGYS